MTDLVCSERKECAVFRELLRIVPGLERQLMDLSEEEVIVIVDLVCFFLTIVVALIAVCRISDSEGCQWCQSRWHQGDERPHHRLDYSERAVAEPSHSPQCQVWTRFPPWPDWSAPLSSRSRLEQHQVSPFLLLYHSLTWMPLVGRVLNWQTVSCK